SRGTRAFLRQAARREEPRARAVGARSADLPASPAARACVGAVRRPEPGDAARDPAHRRHLLPEAVDGRDAVRPHVAGGGANGSRVSRVAPAVLPAALADDHRIVRGPAIPGEQDPRPRPNNRGEEDIMTSIATPRTR